MTERERECVCVCVCVCCVYVCLSVCHLGLCGECAALEQLAAVHPVQQLEETMLCDMCEGGEQE